MGLFSQENYECFFFSFYYWSWKLVSGKNNCSWRKTVKHTMDMICVLRDFHSKSWNTQIIHKDNFETVDFLEIEIWWDDVTCFEKELHEKRNWKRICLFNNHLSSLRWSKVFKLFPSNWSPLHGFLIGQVIDNVRTVETGLMK